jgi:hypothetical protein
MPELRQLRHTPRDEVPTVRVAGLAGRQSGVITRPQLQDLGASRTTIVRWVQAGRLHKVYPGVYMVGHRAMTIRARLLAAVLYCEPGAAISHLTAAAWWGLLRDSNQHLSRGLIHVTTTNSRARQHGLRLHVSRRVQRVIHRCLPVTPPERTLRDIAPHVPESVLRRALAQADHDRLVTHPRLVQVLGRGRPGSTALRRAIDAHYPELAQTLSVLEERFLALCESAAIPRPQVNVTLHGLMVDSSWPEARVIVELDGHRAHATPTAIERDRRRDLALRRAGYTVLRYTWQQVTSTPDLVIADLKAVLGSH